MNLYGYAVDWSLLEPYSRNLNMTPTHNLYKNTRISKANT